MQMGLSHALLLNFSHSVAGLLHALSLRVLLHIGAGLSHALSAPSAMLKASLQEGTPPTIQEEQPLLAADSCDSHGFPARLQSSPDHSAHSSSSCGGTSSSSAPAVQVPAHALSAPCASLAYPGTSLVPSSLLHFDPRGCSHAEVWQWSSWLADAWRGRHGLMSAQTLTGVFGLVQA